MPVDRLTAGRAGQSFKDGSPALPRWATYCESRNPVLKLHKSKGQAMGALSNKMPHAAIQVLEYSTARDQWFVYIDFVPPVSCERCGGPFRIDGDPLSGREHEDRLGDKRPIWQRDIICKVCKTADRIDNWMQNNTHGNLPYGIKGYAFDRLVQLAPEYKDKWNWCVDAHHEYKKRLGKV